MVSLIKLLEQSLLTEGRVEDVLKKYQGKITPETVNKFVEAQNKIDPSINNKYLDWMASAFVAGGSTDQIINAVDVFDSAFVDMQTYNTFVETILQIP